MESAKFEYQCRRCGKVDVPCGMSVDSGFDNFISAIQKKDETPIKLINFHRCDDSGYGITDLIGYK